MSFGLTNTGFTPKRITDITAELDVLFRAAFGAGIKTTPDTNFGKLIGVLADREASLWELTEAVYGAFYPNSASGVSLARIGEITNIAPNAATPSTVVLYVGGTDSTLIPAESLVATQDAGDQFETLADATILGSQKSVISLTRAGATVTANVTAHGLSAGQFFWHDDAVEVEYNGLHQVTNVVDPDNYEYTIAGTPSSPATGTITMLPATAVDVQAVETGPVQALTGTLTEIVNAVPGWSRAENAVDATKGADAESDADFRQRRLDALAGLGAATVDAIRGAVLAITGVTTAKVFENTTSETDPVSGRPPHSFEVLALGGVDQDILDTIFAEKAAGIETFGTTSGTVTDSQGNDHTVRFSRPASVAIWIEIDLTVDASFPGVQEVEDRVLAFGDALDIGEDVIVYPALIGSFDDVPGILNVAIRIGTAPSPTLDDNIPIGETELADFDSARTTVVTL